MRTFNADLLNDEYKISTPFTALISGSSGAGKTTFIKNLLVNDKIEVTPKTIYYHYPPELTSIPVKVRVRKFAHWYSNSFNKTCFFQILDSGINSLMQISSI